MLKIGDTANILEYKKILDKKRGEDDSVIVFVLESKVPQYFVASYKNVSQVLNESDG